MGLPVDRVGSFRGEIVAYGLKEMDSGAVSVAVQVRLLEWYGSEPGMDPQWYEFASMNMECEGDFWIVSGKDKGNKPNENAAKSLMEHAGWDGSFDSIVNQTWEPKQCQVLVKDEEYTKKNGQTVKTRKIAFINDWDRTPGGNLSNVTPEKAKELSERYGAQFRALAASSKRNGTTPSGAPMPPPRPAPAAMAPAPPGSGSNDIPF